MKKPGTKNVGASVRQRLLNKARETGRPFSELGRTRKPVGIGGDSALEIQHDCLDSVEDFVKAGYNFEVFGVADKSALELYASGGSAY